MSDLPMIQTKLERVGQVLVLRGLGNGTEVVANRRARDFLQ